MAGVRLHAFHAARYPVRWQGIAGRSSPYFDTAIEIMDTTATVVDAVPLELLPDSTEQELQ